MDNASSLSSRVKKTDARELESFYKQYYEQYVVSLNKGEQADSSAREGLPDCWSTF
ncbi:Callose synthase 5 [Orobanche hederae]